jgi:hypothetical protein
VIPNISGGGDTAKRIAYLIGKGHRGEHVSPHLIGAQGWGALPEKGPAELLVTGDVKAITAWLDEPMNTFERYPRRRTERVAVEQPDGTVSWQLTGELKPAHYRGWSLTLPEGEKLTDEQWGQVADAFMTRMEFHGRGSDVPCRWVAVHHGGSGSHGLDHIHIAGNVVAEDGTVWSDYRERERSHQACDEIAQELVFQRPDGSTFQLSRVDGHQHKRGQKGFVRGELESDYERGIDVGEPVADGAGEPRRTERGRVERVDPTTARPANGTRRTLERIVSEAAKAARDEIDFVALLRAETLRVKPRFAKGGEQVVGYSVAFKGRGEPWFSGTRLGHDLKLTAIRAAGNWPELDPRTVAEVWNNPRARAPLPPSAELLARAELGLEQLRKDLAKVDPGDQVTWAHAARDAAAVLSTWSLRVESTPGPIAEAAYALRASATIHRIAGDRRRWLAAQAGRDACNALLRHHPARTSKELVRQVSQLLQQITEAHVRSLQEQRAFELEIVSLNAIATLEGLTNDRLAPADARPLDAAFDIAGGVER